MLLHRTAFRYHDRVTRRASSLRTQLAYETNSLHCVTLHHMTPRVVGTSRTRRAAGSHSARRRRPRSCASCAAWNCAPPAARRGASEGDQSEAPTAGHGGRPRHGMDARGWGAGGDGGASRRGEWGAGGAAARARENNKSSAKSDATAARAAEPRGRRGRTPAGDDNNRSAVASARRVGADTHGRHRRVRARGTPTRDAIQARRGARHAETD